MIEFEHCITDPVGLHATPARKMCEYIKEQNIKSRITIEANHKSADATKLIRVISLGIVTGTTIRVRVEGDDEDDATILIRRFFNENV